MHIDSVKLITVDPGHFHAALVQKTMYENVDPVVHIYAPGGADVDLHLSRIEAYNSRREDPTRWSQEVYTGEDFFQKMLAEKKGNVAVFAGNNREKTEYVEMAVQNGLHVLADKPMAINGEDFETLKQAFAAADQNNVLLYDIMTERFEITTVLQKTISQIPAIFGQLENGTPDNPAVTKESVHHFYKFVSGNVLTRPAWFFDVTQEGEGLVDVTTHLVDLIQWECFPEQVIDYQNDIQIGEVKRWPTAMTLDQFGAVTRLNAYPDFLAPYIEDDVLNIYSNGEINYRISGVHARVSVTWAYRAPEGAGDTHYSIMRGSNANLVIEQGAEQEFKSTLYIEPLAGGENFDRALKESFAAVQASYPGVRIQKHGERWEVVIPDGYRIGHEAHFAEVMRKFLEYLKHGNMPEWEVPNMIAKYYVTTAAFEKARVGK